MILLIHGSPGITTVLLYPDNASQQERKMWARRNGDSFAGRDFGAGGRGNESHTWRESRFLVHAIRPSGVPPLKRVHVITRGTGGSLVDAHQGILHG